MWVVTHEEQAKRTSFKELALESGEGGIAGEQANMEWPSGEPSESSERVEHPQEDARDDIDLPGQSVERGRPRDVDEDERQANSVRIHAVVKEVLPDEWIETASE